jgi:hypothetical protein
LCLFDNFKRNDLVLYFCQKPLFPFSSHCWLLFNLFCCNCAIIAAAALDLKIWWEHSDGFCSQQNLYGTRPSNDSINIPVTNHLRQAAAPFDPFSAARGGVPLSVPYREAEDDHRTYPEKLPNSRGGVPVSRFQKNDHLSILSISNLL